MHLLPIALLVKSATGGNAQALATLIGMAIGANTFLARRASKALREHFNIETKDPSNPCC